MPLDPSIPQPQLTSPTPPQSYTLHDVYNQLLQGFQQSYANSNILTPTATNWVDRNLPKPVSDDYHTLNALAATAAGAYGGLQGGIYGAASYAGVPKLGADINSMLDVSPAAGMGAPRFAGPDVSVKPPRTMPLADSGWSPINHPSELLDVNYTRINPQTGALEGFFPPEGLGTTVRPTVDATYAYPKEVRHMGEKALLDMPPHDGPDHTIYVPGTTPTLGAKYGDLNSIAVEKALREHSTDFYDTIDRRNDAMRTKHLWDAVSPNGLTLDGLKNLRNQMADSDLREAFSTRPNWTADQFVQSMSDPSTAGFVDARDAYRFADNHLSNVPDNMQNLKQGMASLMARMVNEHGDLEDRPEALHGVREYADMLQNRTVNFPNDITRRAFQNFKDMLGDAITKGVPGYQKYLDNYRLNSQPIDALRFAQEHPISNANGSLNPDAFHQMMSDLVTERQNHEDTSLPAVNVSDQVMKALWNVHADIKRETRFHDLLDNAEADPTMMAGFAPNASSKSALRAYQTLNNHLDQR